MEYTNQQLSNYVNRIKLTQEQKSSYAEQIDNLKEKIIQAINGMENTRVTRVRRAGSWKKGTALAPKGDYPLDIDMVFFLDLEEDTSFDAEELREEIIKVLCDAYPNKERSDFTDGQKTIGVVFRGSGLEVDIVPFIPERSDTTYGRQPRKRLNSGEFKTSVDKQLDFISEIKEKCSNFTSIVRILKSWRNYQELELSSFSIELAVAHLIRQDRISASFINLAVITFFEFFGNGKDIEVYFPGAIGEQAGSAPWIADPTNNENNTVRLSHSEWEEVVEAAECGFDTITYARAVREAGETLDLWKEIFGPSFNIQEQE
ncbi:MAG: nucleotidyltransferase [Nitrospira sp. SB0677_bin_15]|nr:nucleotidyltransferase [Nitrospira sp. SB0667_bin_9]MYD30883.1 nucleotidyltransferase [Nitrospira sp. SB0661_bin_20]MYG39615.1 nucleotidyltransferase [Nitrospira sp. SB0677_bin_15]MYH01533.1 nucleotidyltransferase [Nitrospira sp. SB0675_bin_23]